MRKVYFLPFVSLLSVSVGLLTGCASIVQGTTQKILVQTKPEQGACCYLKNDRGCWYLRCTPGVVVVHRSSRNLFITAQKPGYQATTVCVKSCTTRAVYGNILAGGLIGAGVDCANGAAFNYPCEVVIPMKPVS